MCEIVCYKYETQEIEFNKVKPQKQKDYMLNTRKIIVDIGQA